VLAQLEEIDGVDGSSVNDPGTLIRVSVQPTADPARVAEQVERILDQQVMEPNKDSPADGPPSLGKRAEATALQREQWHDSSQVFQQAAVLKRTDERRLLAWLVGLLLLGAIAVLGFLRWRRRRHRLASLAAVKV
jgi:hypothetical protein